MQKAWPVGLRSAQPSGSLHPCKSAELGASSLSAGSERTSRKTSVLELLVGLDAEGAGPDLVSTLGGMGLFSLPHADPFVWLSL